MHHTIPRLDNTLPINYTEYDTSTLEAELMERKQQFRLTMEYVPVLVIMRKAIWRFA